MTSDTVEEIVKRVRRDCNSYPLPTAAAEMLKLVREIEAAHRREVETARIATCSAQARFNEVLKERDAAIAELRERLVASVHDGTIDHHEALKIAEDSLAAIHEKGGVK